MRLIRAFLPLCLCVSLSSCSDNRFEVDTQSIEYNPEFSRLDKALFENSGSIAEKDMATYHAEFGDFLNIYLIDIMRIGPYDNPMSPELLSRFTADPTWQNLQDEILKVHPNLEEEKVEISDALRRFAVHFQEDSLPSLVAYNSGFNVGIYPSDSWLGVGLEWYSGTDNPVVQQLPPDLFPQYKREKMKPEYLVNNALKGWLFVKFQDEMGDRLIDRMVFSGKVLFLTKVLQIEVPESILLNFTDEEIEWAEANEYDIWKHFLENDLLFSSEPQQVNKIMTDGPFTPGMPTESPGGIGNWVGYQIVKSFMESNENIGLPELMQLKNDQMFLKYYKPGR